MRRISISAAKRAFSDVIEQVERGETFLITRRGRPVAELLPCTNSKADESNWVAAYERMMARLEEGVPLGGLRVDRQDLYRP